MSAPVRIQFLNHASVKFITDTVKLVSDPWYSGSIFNHGWSLIWTAEQLAAMAADSDFIWVSHEHPDHFSPAFFNQLRGPRPEVLFQATRDRRVARYLGEHGFTVREIRNHERVQLSPAEYLTIGKNALYDSWNLFESGETRILNLNDCIIKTAADLRAVKKRVGHVDVLLTQFSYAGWVGDRSNKGLREDAARRRLGVMRAQIQHLEPTFVIPFASFAWFSHEENTYLNDSVNHVADFLDMCADLNSVPIVMQPLETWRVGEPHDNAPAIRFWDRAFDAIPSFPRRPPGPSIEVADLRAACAAYQRRVFAKNSKLWMRILAAVPFVGMFGPVRIRLTDIARTVRFSFFDELREVENDGPVDVEMASDSLAFIFAHEFGYDTLMVNARCSGTKAGLDVVMRNFGIGNLNTMGWSIGPRMLWLVVRDFRLVWLVLRELKNVNPE